MRQTRRFLAFAAICFAAACASESTAPLTDDSDVSLDGGALGLVGSVGGATGATAMVPSFPADIKLSDAQRAQITQLISAFQDAARADLQALGAIQRKADEARRAGKSMEEVKAILQSGHAIRLRIQAAEQKLRADIDAVLTPAQREWLKSRQPKVCADAGPILSPAQQSQIRDLMRAFEEANKADLVLVAKTMEEARAAKHAGKTDAEIRAILAKASEAQARLEASHKALQDKIEAVLSPAQKTTGCFTRRP